MTLSQYLYFGGRALFCFALAILRVSFWSSVAFLRTTLYTLFLSLEEAFLIKSENDDDFAGFALREKFMLLIYSFFRSSSRASGVYFSGT